jgi:predicted MFS family arabinose efflux permease
MSRAARSLAPVRHRGFRLLVTGQLASNFGDAFYAVALPWYVLAGHGGPLLLAAVLAAYGIPRTALVAIGGHASDRWHPWTVMMTADAVRAVAVAVLAAAALSGPPDAVVLIPIAAVIGAGEGLFLPGSFSIIPPLLPDADLQAGNALAISGTQLASFAGPVIGGGLVAVAGPATAFVLDAVSFVISAATLAGVRAAKRQAPPGQDESPAGRQQRPGALRRLVRSERVLQVTLLVVLAANLGTGGLAEVALPALARGPFHAGAAGYGGLVAAFGGGALLGTLAASQAGRLRRPVVVASLAFLGEAAFVAVVPYLGSAVPAGAALAVFGAFNGFGNVLTITAFQRWAPPDLLGRLMGLILLASFGIFPVSAVLAGVVVHDFGPAPFFPAAAAVLAIAVLAGLTQRPWRELGAVVPGPAPNPSGPAAGRGPAPSRPRTQGGVTAGPAAEE